MPLVETYGPDSVRPGSNQYGAIRQLSQVRKQLRSDSTTLIAGANISMADKGHVFDLLNTHYSLQRTLVLITPEHHALVDFMPQFVHGHVRFRPAILRDNA